MYWIYCLLHLRWYIINFAVCAWFNADERCVTLPAEPLPQKWYFEQF